jgi:uncharacterized membrane protein
MNPVVDTIMLVLFVLFMFWIVHGFVRTQHDKKVNEIEKNEQKGQSEKESNN